MAKSVGILSFQGDFDRHARIISSLGHRSIPVRTVEGLAELDALIIPGGESTTIGMLMDRFGLLSALRDRISEGLPVFGTCAGAILLARTIESSDQPRIGVMDISVVRNAYGRQIESFEADVEVPILPDRPVRGVFIRAPIISEVGESVSVLAHFESRPVVVRQGSLLAATFHPELAGDARLHELFIAF
jgi:5'-phosphate synthase pdxT subunit